jgi:hypothetical protein
VAVLLDEAMRAMPMEGEGAEISMPKVLEVLQSQGVTLAKALLTQEQGTSKVGVVEMAPPWSKWVSLLRQEVSSQKPGKNPSLLRAPLHPEVEVNRIEGPKL